MRNTILLLCILGTAASTSTQAQRPGPPGDQREQALGQHRGATHADRRARGAATADSLFLSPEQRTSVERLTHQLRADLQASRAIGERDDDSRDRARVLMQRYQSDIAALLSPEQASRLQEIHVLKGGDAGGRGPVDDADRTARRDSLKSAVRVRYVQLKPMYGELAQLRRDSVHAAMLELRIAFDRELTASERDDIDALRSAMSAQRKSFKADLAGSDEELAHAAVKAAREAFAREHEAEISAVRSIVERHEAALSEVRVRLKAKELAWAAEADAIRAKYLSPEELQRSGDHRRHASHDDGAAEAGHRRHGGSGGRTEGDPSEGASIRRDSHAQRGAIRFLLMKPGETEEDSIEREDSFGESRMNVYPNPAATSTNVDFDVRANGPVRVELIDLSGRVLQVLLNERRAVGQVRLSVELPAGAGSALLRIVDAQGVRTQVVAKADKAPALGGGVAALHEADAGEEEDEAEDGRGPAGAVHRLPAFEDLDDAVDESAGAGDGEDDAEDLLDVHGL